MLVVERAGPEVVEDQVTYPLTTAMLSVPFAKTVRGYSFFGFSMVYVIFADGTALYWARSRVLEYPTLVPSRLPAAPSPPPAAFRMQGCTDPATLPRVEKPPVLEPTGARERPQPPVEPLRSRGQVAFPLRGKYGRQLATAVRKLRAERTRDRSALRNPEIGRAHV